MLQLSFKIYHKNIKKYFSAVQLNYCKLKNSIKMALRILPHEVNINLDNVHIENKNYS